MMRFETMIGVVGGAADDRMLLEFGSTIVAGDFPSGEILSGAELRKRIGASFVKYRRRLLEVRTENFAAREIKRLKEIVGERYEKISENKEYEIIYSEEHLCSCELSDRQRYCYR